MHAAARVLKLRLIGLAFRARVLPVDLGSQPPAYDDALKRSSTTTCWGRKKVDALNCFRRSASTSCWVFSAPYCAA